MAAKVDWPKIDTILKRADLSMTEAAEILPVTRQTLYNWERGNQAANQFILDHCLKKLDLVSLAVTQGLLPLKEDFPKEKKMQEVSNILRAVYSSRKTKR